MGSKPNIVVLGVDHSGTSIVTSMLEALGWNNPFIDEEESYRENVRVRAYNRWLQVNGGYEPGLETQPEYDITYPHAMTTFNMLSPENFYEEMIPYKPWVVKDPRFFAFWNYWRNLFECHGTFLLALTRDPVDLSASYVRRGQTPHTMYGELFGAPCETAQIKVRSIYEEYDGPKLHLSFNDIASAISLFDVARAQPQENPHAQV